MQSKSKHSLFECVSLRKSLNAPLPDQEGKRKDQEDDYERENLGGQRFLRPKEHCCNILGVYNPKQENLNTTSCIIT
jgi:hypothetical protein